jgi:hypothetical protein
MFGSTTLDFTIGTLLHVQVRNIDGFTKSIMRRIQDEGIDVGTGDLSQLSHAVEDAILRQCEGGVVARNDFVHQQVVTALKQMSDDLAIDVRSEPLQLSRGQKITLHARVI